MTTLLLEKIKNPLEFYTSNQRDVFTKDLFGDVFLHAKLGFPTEQDLVKSLKSKESQLIESGAVCIMLKNGNPKWFKNEDELFKNFNSIPNLQYLVEFVNTIHVHDFVILIRNDGYIVNEDEFRYLQKISN